MPRRSTDKVSKKKRSGHKATENRSNSCKREELSLKDDDSNVVIRKPLVVDNSNIEVPSDINVEDSFTIIKAIGSNSFPSLDSHRIVTGNSVCDVLKSNYNGSKETMYISPNSSSDTSCVTSNISSSCSNSNSCSNSSNNDGTMILDHISDSKQLEGSINENVILNYSHNCFNYLCMTHRNECVPNDDFKVDFKNFALGQLTKHNAALIKKLNDATLPILYSEKFYQDLPDHYEFSRLAYIGEIMTGAICCRLENFDENSNKFRKLNIMTIAVLQPYRRHNIGRRLLQYILNLASRKAEIREAYLHVWTENIGAVRLYQSLGFELVGRVSNYYDSLNPSASFRLRCGLPWLYCSTSSSSSQSDMTLHNLT